MDIKTAQLTVDAFVFHLSWPDTPEGRDFAAKWLVLMLSGVVPHPARHIRVEMGW